MTYPPPRRAGMIPNFIVFPLLRNVVGRTLYADMHRMVEILSEYNDVAWTIMRPERLFDTKSFCAYRVDIDHPSRPHIARADLAAAMVAELDQTAAHLRQALAQKTLR